MPIYDIKKTYLENAEEGPFFEEDFPKREWPPESEWIDFLGYRVASPIGVPAGPLLNAKWIGLAAKLGYDVVAYKTIRSHQHPSHPLPNVLPVETEGQLIPGHLPDFVMASDEIDPSHPAITNSFGNPSRSREYLQKDLPLANSLLHKGQIMITSVFGTAREGVDVLDDYVNAALFAKECGSRIIEANYSCPNVASHEGSLYADPEVVYTLTSRLTQALKDTPLIIKVGTFTEVSQMRDVFVAAARAGVRAICGINTISMKVLDKNHQPALGNSRLSCGICGTPIREAALRFTQKAREIIETEKLDLTLISTGGVTEPEHFNDLLQAGANIAMTASGMMWDPFLAAKFHKQQRVRS